MQWTEQGGIIRFSVTSDGMTGPEWIKNLKTRGVEFEQSVLDLLRSSGFRSTSGRSYRVAILRGTHVAGDMWVGNITRAARARRLRQLPLEAAFLVEATLSNKLFEDQLRLARIQIVHRYLGAGRLLLTHFRGCGRWLEFRLGPPCGGWPRETLGFAFLDTKG